MSLINQINGSLLTRLASIDLDAAPGTSSRASSQSSSSESAAVNLGVSLNNGQVAFLRSAKRLNEAMTFVRTSLSYLESFTGVVGKLKALAETAADPLSTAEDRSRLNSKFLTALTELKAITASASNKDTNYLDVTDLADVLKEQGVKVNSSTVLSQAFSRIGGRDSLMGTERIVLDDQNVVNPLSLNVSTLENAVQAAEAFDKLDKIAKADLSALLIVDNEVTGALGFSLAAQDAFKNLMGLASTGISPEALASEIVRKIKASTSDPGLSQHSGLDSILVMQLTA